MNKQNVKGPSKTQQFINFERELPKSMTKTQKTIKQITYQDEIPTPKLRESYKELSSTISTVEEHIPIRNDTLSELHSSSISFLYRDVQCQKKQTKSVIKQEPIENPKFDIKSDTLDFLLQADKSIVEIRDEDIIFDEAHRKKKLRQKPDQKKNFEDVKFSKRKIADNIDPDYDKQNEISIADDDGYFVQEEDSVEEESDDEPDQKKQVKHHEYQYTEGIVFNKFDELSGYPQSKQSKNNQSNTVKKLFYMNQNSIPLLLKQEEFLLPDYEEKKWQLLRYALQSKIAFNAYKKKVDLILTSDFDYAVANRRFFRKNIPMNQLYNQ